MPDVYKNNGKEVKVDKGQKGGSGKTFGDSSEQNEYSGTGDQNDPLWLQRSLSCTRDITIKFTK